MIGRSKNSARNQGSPPGELRGFEKLIYKMLKLKSELVADFAKPVMNPIYSEDRNLLIFAEFANLLQNDLSSLQNNYN